MRSINLAVAVVLASLSSACAGDTPSADDILQAFQARLRATGNSALANWVQLVGVKCDITGETYAHCQYSLKIGQGWPELHYDTFAKRGDVWAFASR